MIFGEYGVLDLIFAIQLEVVCAQDLHFVCWSSQHSVCPAWPGRSCSAIWSGPEGLCGNRWRRHRPHTSLPAHKPLFVTACRRLSPSGRFPRLSMNRSPDRPDLRVQNQAGAALLSDAGETPGALIETFLLTNLPTLSGPNGFPLIQITSTLNPILVAVGNPGYSVTGGGIRSRCGASRCFGGDPSDGGAKDAPPLLQGLGLSEQEPARGFARDRCSVQNPLPFSWPAVGVIALATLARRKKLAR